MSLVLDSYVQAELALASYSNLTAGISGNDYTDALRDAGKGMSDAQATAFAGKFTVVEIIGEIIGDRPPITLQTRNNF